MKIGFTYDVKTDWQAGSNDPVDASAEFDNTRTIEEITSALEAGGHEVKRIGNIWKLISQIEQLDVDIVLNICEGVSGRNRESQVPMLLELYDIPFVGADALTLGMTLDKVTAKKCFIMEGIPTPKFFVAHNSKSLHELNHIGFPLMVKTRYEGSSKGISELSRVENYQGLKRQVDLINEMYQQSALVEEFIRGQEFTVPVLGNEQPEAMPIVQVSIDGKLDLGNEFYAFSRLTSDSLQYICPAKISDELTKEIQAIAVKAYQSVGCRDFGRVDFRVDEKGKPYVLEINPLPVLSKEDAFNLFPQVLGSTHERAINQIIDIAAKRCGLDSKERGQTANKRMAASL